MDQGGNKATFRELAGFARRSHAARAELDLFRLAVLDNSNRLDIGVKAPAGVAFTEAHRVAE